MKQLIVAALMGLSLLSFLTIAEATLYDPTWESIDGRPCPKWFQDAKFGIFIHWGVYSVPAWGPKGQYAEWYWRHMHDKNGQTRKFHVGTYGEDFKYQDFAPMFKAEMYDPKKWADIFKRSGARYVVLTSKHHEGFCLWPNPQSWNWNSADIGPHRDLAGDLIEAVHDAGLRMGFYYSLYEWYNPLYRSDVKRYVDEHMLPQIKDLVTRYKPDIVWGDGEWEHPSEVWRSTEFLAWLFNESPAPQDVVINDRWGKETRGKHGSFCTTEYGLVHGEGVSKYTKAWEECRGMGASFGYNRNEDVSDYKSATSLILTLIEIVSKGGNLLLDIGPTGDGRIPVIMQERLFQIGEWLKVNGEAIYHTRPWRKVSDGKHVRYTAKGDAVYAICLRWPGTELVLSEPKADEVGAITMLDLDRPLKWQYVSGKLRIEVPPLSIDELPCQHAYVFKLTPRKDQSGVRTSESGQPDAGRVREHVRRVQAEVQIALFVHALDDFYVTTGVFPTREEGLRVLIQKPTDPTVAACWDGPYLRRRSLPKDPWGNDYHYRVPGIDGTDYDIMSYGRDGVEGGEGPDADISNHDLQRVDE